MSRTPQFATLTRSPLHRAAVLCLLVVALVAVGTTPAFASYEWCSKDPLIAFTRQTAPGEAAVSHLLDVELMVPVRASALGRAATVTVTMPSNVTAQQVTPGFRLDSTFKPVLDPVLTDSYQVRIAADVPATFGDYPVRLVLTDPLSGTSLTCEGQTDQTVQATAQFAPFAAACQ